MLHNFDVEFFQEFCYATCLMKRRVILMKDPIVDQLRYLFSFHPQTVINQVNLGWVYHLANFMTQ